VQVAEHSSSTRENLEVKTTDDDALVFDDALIDDALFLPLEDPKSHPSPSPMLASANGTWPSCQVRTTSKD
jgi:hypothetical protein